MGKTEFLETLEGKDVSVTSKPIDVVIDSGEHVEVVPYVRPPFVEPALIPVYTDRRKGKLRVSTSKYTHKEYQNRRRSKNREASRSRRRNSK